MVRSTVTDADRIRAKRMIADLKKRIAVGQRKQDVADLVKFANTPARPSKSQTRKALDSFDAVLKPTKRDPVADFDALFVAPPIPKEKLQ